MRFRSNVPGLVKLLDFLLSGTWSAANKRSSVAALARLSNASVSGGYLQLAEFLQACRQLSHERLQPFRTYSTCGLVDHSGSGRYPRTVLRRSAHQTSSTSPSPAR